MCLQSVFLSKKFRSIANLEQLDVCPLQRRPLRVLQFQAVKYISGDIFIFSYFRIKQVLRSLAPGITIKCSYFCGGIHFLLGHAKWLRQWNSPNMAAPWRKALFLYMQSN